MKRICLQVHRVLRKPEVRWGTHFIKRNLVKTTVLSFVPSEIDDLAIHHATLSIDELVRVSMDTVTIGTLGIILSFASKL